MFIVLVVLALVVGRLAGVPAYADGASFVVIAAGMNPLNERYSVVVLAGLSAEGTTRTPAALFQRSASGANVLVLPHEQNTKAMVIGGTENKN